MKAQAWLYPLNLQAAITSLLTRPAVCTPELRQAIEGYAAKLGGADREAQDIPADLVSYVKKVVLYAYKVTDEDVSRLTAAGYSEDAIFEITLCASVGASAARLERGMLALKGGQDASAGS